MLQYNSKEELIIQIKKTSNLFILEFKDISEGKKDKYIAGVDRTPAQMISYQLGWLNLLINWDRDERGGKKVVTPAPGYKWNELSRLYQSFYKQYEDHSLSKLKDEYIKLTNEFIEWLSLFTEEELFEPEMRQWASSTPSKWPIWKWIHINSVSPFKSFRTKIRRWKRLNLQQKS